MRIILTTSFVRTPLWYSFWSRIFARRRSQIPLPRLAVSPAGETSLQLTKTICAHNAGYVLTALLRHFMRIMVGTQHNTLALLRFSDVFLVKKRFLSRN